MSDKTKRTLTGVVVSNNRDKTIAISTQRYVKHKVYKKYMQRSSKVHAHDEKNECRVGDLVKVVEAAPHSKTKHWTLLAVVNKAVEIE